MKNTIGPDASHRNDPKWNSCQRDEFTMSETFNAAVSMERPRAAGAPAAVLGGTTGRERNRRRSLRRAFETLIRVYGQNTNGTPFYEDAKTINVSVHGALLLLNVQVAKGQKLLLFNEATQRQQVCLITDVRVGDTDSFEVAVAFPTPHAEFWQVPRPPTKCGFNPS